MTDAPREEPRRLRVAVIGGGRMGAGIAQVFLTAGAEVTVQEPEAAAAYARIAKGLAIAESKSTTQPPTTQPPTTQPPTTQPPTTQPPTTQPPTTQPPTT
ncbi:3-hydroxyacyl-CoA dehydrogenase NAD-binding domain-containing protein, partial [Nonomuraea endophytica]|uniref:3-hydroxyacyl-CoA dehydrogenase NAD-binding domain-containing protein n=1 Tax=Nonomuraea endophytica TaxID=714136 RepID=UPI0037CB1D75